MKWTFGLPVCTLAHTCTYTNRAHAYTTYTQKTKKKYVAPPVQVSFTVCVLPSKDKSTSQVEESQVRYRQLQFW